MPFTEIGKDTALGIFEEQAVDRMVLCAALEPVLQIFGRDGELQGQHFRRLILCECACIHLVLQAGEHIEVVAVLGVVVGLDTAV